MMTKAKLLWGLAGSVSLILFVLLAMNPASHTLAAPEVNTWHVATTGNDSGACGSTSQPCRTIQQAINLSGNGDTILVAAGTYTYSGSSTCLDGVSTAVVCVLSRHLTILGGFTTSNWGSANPSSNVTIIDGQNAHRGVQVHGVTADGASLTIEGFTIQNGRKQGSGSGGDNLTFAFGGGMLADRASVTARNLILKNNQALGGNTSSSYGGSGAGGGMAFRSNSNGVVLENIVFENNLARGGTGIDRGGFAIGGGLYTLEAVVTANNLTFTNNTAQAGSSNGSGSSGNEYADAQGGGAAIHNYSTATLDNIVATGNQAFGGDAPNGNAGGSFGGGLFAERATAVFSNIHLEDNLAQGGDGKNPNTDGSLGEGGGFAASHSEIFLDRGTIVNNRAQGGNGAIYEGAGGGGGLYSERFTGTTTVTLENVIVADNITETGTGAVVGGGGGGYFVNGGVANLLHTTFVNNQLNSSPMQGSGLVLINEVTATISHSILANHTTGLTVHAQPGSTVTLDNNLFSGNATNTGGGGTFIGTASIFSGSPDFLSPGAPNYDYRLQSSSAAIDKAASSSTASDFERDDRTQYGQPDVGADEYAPIFLTVIPGDGQLRLNWEPKALLLPGVNKYEIHVAPSSGAASPNEGTTINANLQTSFTLTGLTNFKDYTIFIEARNSSNSVIGQSNSVTKFPTDIAVYLPSITR